MSCQILSALLLEALSARLLYSAARWRRGCSHRGCSRRGGLDSGHVSREVSVTIWGRKKNQTHPTPAVLMGLNHAAATWCCSGRHNSFIRVRMRGIVASTAGTCALCTHRWVCTLKILGISVVCLEWVQRECGVTDLTVGYAHMLGSSTSGSWRNTHTHRGLCSLSGSLVSHLPKVWIMPLKWFHPPSSPPQLTQITVADSVVLHLGLLEIPVV